MLANAGKRHQHWTMSPNCQKKFHPWVRRRRQKKLKRPHEEGARGQDLTLVGLAHHD